ncbi:hypothetical protein TraAM80_04512 [Trypanosoma rangeli]|uniref:Uncharacterized protein n=1 Tax=Trypanosoma rangeli TaxID=5698 RepID=A0A422NJ94_TRYRA|nr:uncharacterized protein TraAM80_04512 [Trypanosoma rangeli]RNF05474.1 hypothetical protein TraAM80_04512 [Trypanosoma rangeli]|eukprot:RNF05474.1 hypothetical protein TraAM80_04512 [Trypanosoma rangeli]
MSFAPPRKQLASAATAASYSGRRRSGYVTESPSAASPRSRVTSIYHAPPHEAVKEQMRRYAQSICRRQAPPDGVTVSTSHFPRGGTKRGAGMAPTGRQGGLLSPRNRVRIAERSGDVLSSSPCEFSEPCLDASRIRGTDEKMKVKRLPFYSNGADSPRHWCSYTSANGSHLHQHPATSPTTDDVASDEHVSNPYILSVLRGAEQRWAPPFLVHPSINDQCRCQSLDHYNTGQSPYLSRRELMREWKRRINGSPINGFLQAPAAHKSKSDGGKYGGVEDEIKQLHSVDSPGGESAADLARLHMTYAPASMPPFSLGVEGAMKSHAGGYDKAWGSYTRSPEGKEGVEGIVVALPHRGVEAKAREFKMADTASVKLTFLDDDVVEDTRAYLYAPLISGATPLARKAHGCSSPLELRAGSGPAGFHEDDSGDVLHCVGDANRAQESHLTLKHETGSLLTAANNVLLHQQGMNSGMEQTSFDASLCRPWSSTTTNYLIAPETVIVDTSGAAWVATLVSAAEAIAS